MYVIEAGEEVIIAITSHRIVYLFFASKRQIFLLIILVKGDDQLPSHGGGGWRGLGGPTEVSQVRYQLDLLKHFCLGKSIIYT